MATKVRAHTSQKQVIRFKRKRRIKGGGVEGSAERPRLAVFRSNKNIYVQLIDDTKGHTLVSASTAEEELKKESGSSIAGAKTVGSLVA
ncbi:MAG: 50S ribosomal protein L18, partial [Pseudobdellovibrionaceae bacterium]